MNPMPTQQPQSPPPSGTVVWRKGWIYPILYAIMFAVTAGVFGLFLFAPGRSAAGEFVLPGLFLILAVGAVGTAIRRKLTLTPNAVVVRTLFQNKTIPLREITELSYAYGDNGLFAMKAVRIKAGRMGIATKSFGTHQREGIGILTDAAIAQGARIYGVNAEREVWSPQGQ